MSHKCKAFSRWRATSGNTMPMQREAFNAGWDAAMERAIELLAAAKKVNALSIQTEAHKELRAAIAKATEHDA